MEKSEASIIEKDAIAEEGEEAMKVVEKGSAVKFTNSDDEEQVMKSISPTVEKSKGKTNNTLTKKLGSKQYQSVGELSTLGRRTGWCSLGSSQISPESGADCTRLSPAARSISSVRCITEFRPELAFHQRSSPRRVDGSTWRSMVR